MSRTASDELAGGTASAAPPAAAPLVTLVTVPPAGGWRDKAIDRLLLAYCLLTPFVIPLGASRIALVDLLFPAALGLVVTSGRTYCKGPQRWMAAIVGAALLSLTQVRNAQLVTECAGRAVRFLAIVMPLMLAMTKRPDQQLLRKGVWAYFLGGALSMVIAIALYALQIDYGREVQTFQFGDTQLGRAAGIFGDSSQFGHMLGTWMAIGLVALPATRVAHWRDLGLRTAVLLLGLECLYISLSRAALLNLLGVIFAACIIPGGAGDARRFRRAFKWPAIGVVVLLAAAVTLAVGTTLLDEVKTTLELRFVEETVNSMPDDPNAAVAGRLGNWGTAWLVFLEHPVLGGGFKALVLGKQVPVDNQFLGMLADTGAVGFLSLTGFVLSVLVGLFRRAVAGGRLAWAMVAVWVGQLLQFSSADVLTFWGGTPGLLTLTGLVLSTPVSPNTNDTGDSAT